MLAEGGATRVEIDLRRQVLFYWRDGALLRVLPVSTGTGRRYCEERNCGVAVTPSGSFRVERRIRGKHKSPLGLLYDPLFFTGGYALHGSPSGPPHPPPPRRVPNPPPLSRWVYEQRPHPPPRYL